MPCWCSPGAQLLITARIWIDQFLGVYLPKLRPLIFSPCKTSSSFTPRQRQLSYITQPASTLPSSSFTSYRRPASSQFLPSLLTSLSSQFSKLHSSSHSLLLSTSPSQRNHGSLSHPRPSDPQHRLPHEQPPRRPHGRRPPIPKSQNPNLTIPHAIRQDHPGMAGRYTQRRGP
jgi:hypothetical protein